jgi:hypothetical protein
MDALFPAIPLLDIWSTERPLTSTKNRHEDVYTMVLVIAKNWKNLRCSNVH